MFKKLCTPFILGYGFFNKIKFFLIVVWFPIIRKFNLNFDFEYKVRIFSHGKTFYFYPTDGSDIGVLREIFIENEYYVFGIRPNIIVDLGSNVGLSVIYFKLLYPDSLVYAFEPDPVTFAKLKKNTAQFNGIYLFNQAVSDKSGFLDFYVNKDSSMSSSLYDRRGNQEKIPVKSITFSDLLKECSVTQVDLLKFDIEGAEFGFFSNNLDISKIRYLIGEVHEDIVNKKVDSFINFFPRFLIKSKKQIYPKRFVVQLANNI